MNSAAAKWQSESTQIVRTREAELSAVGLQSEDNLQVDSKGHALVKCVDLPDQSPFAYRGWSCRSSTGTLISNAFGPKFSLDQGYWARSKDYATLSITIKDWQGRLLMDRFYFLEAGQIKAMGKNYRESYAK